MLFILIFTLPILLKNVFAKVENDLKEIMQSMISDEDLALFNRPEGLWFADDEGKLVRATMDIPNVDNFLLGNIKNKVFFYLHTRDISEPDSLFVDDIPRLQLSNFNASRPTKFITHGWVNSKNSRACRLPRDAYLVHGDYNVIVVDWSRITMRPYLWAASHVKTVSRYVAKMVDFLVSQGANLNTMTLVGHSLGAHVMGLAGYHSLGEVNYVVGLDPALPLFSTASAGKRISTKDAKHVEIIHTNAGLLGYLSPIGTADFYPNGGYMQFGCLHDLSGHCSHCRSFEYFAESLNSDVGFYGKKCSLIQYVFGKCNGDLGQMGTVRYSLPCSGKYYFKTKKTNPFANGA